MFDYTRTIREYREYFHHDENIETKRYLNEIRKMYLSLDEGKGTFAGLLILLAGDYPANPIHKWLSSYSEEKIHILCNSEAKTAAKSLRDNINGNGRKIFAVEMNKGDYKDICFDDMCTGTEGRQLSEKFKSYLSSSEFINKSVDEAVNSYVTLLANKKTWANQKEKEKIEQVSERLVTQYALLKEKTTLHMEAENLLVFGAPGTGKSFYVHKHYEEHSISTRVIFHEEYANQDFIGCIKPVLIEGLPTYKFVPGPFTKILASAIENPAQNYTLIIEELNRANAATVFGEVFQLLDRNIDGVSEYRIENENVLTYINEHVIVPCEEIRLPKNLSIVATMNSADQGVFPIDTAFKRRWNYQYMPIAFTDFHQNTKIPYVKAHEDIEDEKPILISIKDYIETINTFLSEQSALEINEDRLIGPYYLKPNEWQVWETKGTYKKLFTYLWDDVTRLDRHILFKENFHQFAQLCEAVEKHEQVFTDELHLLMKEKHAL